MGIKNLAYYRSLTFCTLFLGYVAYYLCRHNLNDAYLLMKTSIGMDRVTFGALGSFGTFIYAMGKISVGPLVDLKGGRTLFLTGMVGSAMACVLFGMSSSLILFYVFWGVSRYFQSMGWSSVVKIVSQWYPRQTYGSTIGLVAMSYQLGGVVAPLFCGLLLNLGFGWRGLFIVPALILIGVSLLTRGALVNSPLEYGFDAIHPKEENPATKQEEGQTDWIVFRDRLIALFQKPAFLCACGLSFILTLTRECFTFWLPSYYSEMGDTVVASVTKSALLPFLGCVGSFFAGWYSDRFLKGKRGPLLMVFLMGLCLCLFALSRIDQVLSVAQAWSLASPSKSILVTILTGASGFFLYAPYSMVGGGVVALDCAGPESAGTAVGFLDSIGYFAAALSGIGLAYVISDYGWNFLFVLLFGAICLSLLLSLYFIVKEQ